ncbi:hypothetical protein N7457_008232 [Penicillium paradoxum]|uniref:uncharacterized protein n=1 Tax=Penicillium paradoxum TaxID=176176 RepID=UPI0025467716|nr:uncharacterized protein N7457_008232 [Penicillium paradoxum]KAJ5773336.1 hypothetical protein N7457_008232 [Penicillium paradoxum]
MSTFFTSCYLVRIETDTGIVGWAEGRYFMGAPDLRDVLNLLIATFIHDPLGRGITDPRTMWNDLRCLAKNVYGSSTNSAELGRKSACNEAISAIDIALWDICCSLPDKNPCGRPIVSGTLNEYSSTSQWQPVAAPSPQVQEYVKLGFDTLMVKAFDSLERRKRQIRVARIMFGLDATIVVDHRPYGPLDNELLDTMLSSNFYVFMQGSPRDLQSGDDGKKLVYEIIYGNVNIVQPNIIHVEELLPFYEFVILLKPMDTTYGSAIALVATIYASTVAPCNSGGAESEPKPKELMIFLNPQACDARNHSLI